MVRNTHQDTMDILNGRMTHYFVLQLGPNSYLRVEQKVGEGMWSYIYHVREVNSNKDYALKVFPNRGELSKANLEVVESLKALQHKHIVEYSEHFVFRTKGVMFFCIKMEYCQKGTLKQRIVHKHTKKHPFLSETICKFIQQLASALAFIHQRGVLHGDICSANVLCTADDQLKLTGFAGHLRPHRTGTALTITGGSRTNVPPEWATSSVLNRPLTAIERPLHSYDMWGLGCILTELATMKRLQEDQLMHSGALATDQAKLHALISEMAVVHDGVFTDLCEGLLENDPDERVTAEDVPQLIPLPTLKKHQSWVKKTLHRSFNSMRSN